MANIRNSISMVDRMTPTFRSILKSMDSTLRVMKNLDKQSNKGTQSKAYRQAEKDIKRASNALIKMQNTTKMAESAANAAAGGYSKMSMAVNAVGSGLDKIGSSATNFLSSLYHGVMLADKLADKVSEVMTASDTARSQVARLGLYNTSQYSNEELYGQVFATSMNTRSGLTDTADLVNKLLISGVYSGSGSAQAAISTAGIINKALVAGGGTAEENQRALKQLTQGLASGVLQGDELRSIREQTPYFAQMLAEGLSKIDKKFKGIGIGDLKELGAQGELTADRIVKAMWAMQDEVDEDFKAMPKTFGQAVTSLGNIWNYFLFLLSGADGPLGKINDMLWQFVEYLQSPQGLDFINSVAVGINFIATALSGAMKAMGSFVVYLQENAPIAEAIFTGLGAVAVAAAIKTAVSWVAACWPILLIAGVVGVLAYNLSEAGQSSNEATGNIIGGFLAALAVIWDVILGVIAFVVMLGVVLIELVLGIVWLVVFIFQLIAQIISFIILFVINAIQVVLLAIASLFMGLWGVVQWVLGGIEGVVYDVFSGILGFIQVIAEAIDAVFGSSLADTVSQWTKGLDDIHATVSGFLDEGKTFDSIEDMWKSFGEGAAFNWSEESDWNITDNMKDVMGGFGGVMGGLWDWTNNDFGKLFMQDLWVDPGSAFDSGYGFGSDIVKGIEDLVLGFPDGSVLDGFDPKNIKLNGGHLDSIKSDVNVSDEDIQLLRDMAARDYLLQLQSITPVANVKFGDVRETADVNKIVEVIEQMVEEQMATSLVS